MNRAVLSLCVFGAALATANILIMQRPTCTSETDVVAAFKETAPAIITAKGKPAQGAKSAEKPQALKNKAADPANGKAAQTSQAATMKPAAPPKGVDRTGSVNHKPQKPNGGKASQKGSDTKQARAPRPSGKTAQADPWRWPDRYDGLPEYYGPPEFYRPPDYYYGPPVIRFYGGW